MPPKRKHGKDLPPNIYPALDSRDGVTRYRYRDPRDGKFHGLGADKEQAVKDAKALNAAIYATFSRVPAIVEAKPETPMLSAVILKHMELCEIRQQRGKLSANTIKAKRSNSEAIRKALGHKPIGEVTVRDMAELLAGYVERGTERAAVALRSEAIEIWKTAIAEGWVSDNIPLKTRTVDAEVKRERLTLDAYLKIREAANSLQEWVGLSMDLALVTGQRREDVASMQFRPGKGVTAWVEDGSLWVIQSKTDTHVCIPLELRLETVGLSVGDVVNRCRDFVVSRHLIHHKRNYVNANAGDPVFKDAISRGFQRARDLTDLTWEGTPPTFHELRSLAARLYVAQGVDVQALLGHKDASMTAVYRDVRGAEWVHVNAG